MSADCMNGGGGGSHTPTGPGSAEDPTAWAPDGQHRAEAREPAGAHRPPGPERFLSNRRGAYALRQTQALREAGRAWAGLSREGPGKSGVGQLGDSGVRALSTPVQGTAKGPASSPKGFPSSRGHALGCSLLNSRGQKGHLTLRGDALKVPRRPRERLRVRASRSLPFDARGHPYLQPEEEEPPPAPGPPRQLSAALQAPAQSPPGRLRHCTADRARPPAGSSPPAPAHPLPGP